MLIGLQFQVTLQQNKSFEKFINEVCFILFTNKICNYRLSKARLCVLKVSLCICRVFGFFRCICLFLRVDLVFFGYAYLATLLVGLGNW